MAFYFCHVKGSRTKGITKVLYTAYGLEVLIGKLE
jgi:hypothetical protein